LFVIISLLLMNAPSAETFNLTSQNVYFILYDITYFYIWFVMTMKLLLLAYFLFTYFDTNELEFFVYFLNLNFRIYKKICFYFILATQHYSGFLYHKVKRIKLEGGSCMFRFYDFMSLYFLQGKYIHICYSFS